MGNHRLLHRVQATARGEVVDGDDVLAVALAQKLDAGIDRFISDSAVFHAANGDRARAAIALVAAFLRALRAFAQAQIVEQRLVGTDLRKFDAYPVSRKHKMVPWHAKLRKF